MRYLFPITIFGAALVGYQAAQPQATSAPGSDSAAQVAASTYEHLATAIIEIEATEDELVKSILIGYHTAAQGHLKAAARDAQGRVVTSRRPQQRSRTSPTRATSAFRPSASDWQRPDTRITPTSKPSQTTCLLQTASESGFLTWPRGSAGGQPADDLESLGDRPRPRVPGSRSRRSDHTRCRPVLPGRRPRRRRPGSEDAT